MKELRLNKIKELLNVTTHNEDTVIYHVENDIKKIKDDTLVFHLNKKEELDFKLFNKSKNCFIVTDQPILNNNKEKVSFFLHVLDVKKAYQKFIDYYRKLFNLPVIAITGTCGKTTTKEIIKQILEKKSTVAATIGNKNALSFDLGYLLRIDDKTDYGVFETAISYPGNLIFGCNFFKPTIGVITNIGIDHLSGCKTVDNYIRTKGEMLAGLNYQGTLIINHDDDNIKKIDMSPFKGKIITFGIDNVSDYQAEAIVYKDKGMTFTLKTRDKKYKAYIPGYGKHNVYNALAALAVLDELGINIEEAIEDLASITFIRSHLAFHEGINKSIIIDDTWSSNPTSMKAAFEVIQELGKDKVKIAVLGKISYLGDYALEQYENIGKMIVDYKFDILITLDIFSKQIAKSAANHHMKNSRILYCKTIEDLKSTLESLLDSNTMVLFKVSIKNKEVTTLIHDIINE
ncbi:UDP-N-acetylmuramoyl-tripeptide--D-alanyl-D-alanine ligase [Mycoplasmatota bacterium]|nr:UDP-N-acetylmuramoyl-tripeptide--D-alanyl-D-alanine ligase [Mycoplasmatota bacterium]